MKTQKVSIDTNGLTIAQLASVYNAFSLNPIKRFSSKSSGMKRIEFMVENELPEMEPADLEAQIKDLPEDLQERCTLGKKTVKSKSKAKLGGGSNAGRSKKYEGMKLAKTIPFNPFNNKGRRYTGFELIKDGMSVEEFQISGGSVADLGIMIRTGYVAPLNDDQFAKFKEGKLKSKTLRKKFYEELNLRTPLETIEKRIAIFNKAAQA